MTSLGLAEMSRKDKFSKRVGGQSDGGDREAGKTRQIWFLEEESNKGMESST